MAMLMQQVNLPQEEPFGGGATPSPVPTATPVPGAGVPMQKKAPIGPDSPPSDDNYRGPMPGDSIPMPKPKPVVGEIPMPKPKPVVGGEIPMPKPGGPGTAPAAPGTAYGNAAYSGSGGVKLMDWRGGLAETDKNAVTREVQDNELTSKQLSRLLDENGRYIQSARLRSREGSSNSGMLMSTMAAGAAERSAIDAALPIAQGDANTYFQTSSENMRARNEDVQADQNAGRNLFGQTMSLDAQAQDAELGRRFTSGENAANRGFQGEQAGLDRGLTREENDKQRLTQILMQERGISADMARQLVDQEFTSNQNRLTRDQQALLESNRLSQDRFGSYVNLVGQRENQLASTLAAVYGNSNLKPAEQAAAAENVRAIFASLNTGTNAALSAGVPQIFAQPYVMKPPTTPAPGGTDPTTPTAPTGPAGNSLPTGYTPIPGTDLATGPGGIISRIADLVRKSG